ncbi:MAG: alpha-ketoglutarate-dependent dioxygenase AlkB [Halioglobus sp.]|nr:alpha-ketoglutarate-dependent dioxygenase AlkB [Halioglobus sp.]
MNYDLFTPSGEHSRACHRIEMVDAEACLFPALFSECEAARLFAVLRRDILWRQEKIRLYGKVNPLPRLTAWYGDPGTTYRYSGITAEPTPWIPALLEIRARIEAVSGGRFNSVLLNLYRDGADSMAWHADDEPELGRNPVIGSVSFGQSRTLQLKHKREPANRRNIELPNGSYLLMQGAMQHHWLHQVAKSRRPLGERINLTYRKIL